MALFPVVKKTLALCGTKWQKQLHKLSYLATFNQMPIEQELANFSEKGPTVNILGLVSHHRLSLWL